MTAILILLGLVILGIMQYEEKPKSSGYMGSRGMGPWDQ